jgi:hypothetical protein
VDCEEEVGSASSLISCCGMVCGIVCDDWASAESQIIAHMHRNKYHKDEKPCLPSRCTPANVSVASSIGSAVVASDIVGSDVYSADVLSILLLA